MAPPNPKNWVLLVGVIASLLRKVEFSTVSLLKRLLIAPPLIPLLLVKILSRTSNSLSLLMAIAPPPRSLRSGVPSLLSNFELSTVVLLRKPLKIAPPPSPLATLLLNSLFSTIKVLLLDVLIAAPAPSSPV